MPAVGVSSYNASSYGWAAFWGTSWSAPLYAAMQLEVNEACGKNMWGISTLYGAFALPNPYEYDFYDVTSGSDNPGDGQGTFYSATAGFDTASGIGIPLGVNIAIDVCAGDAVRRAGGFVFTVRRRDRGGREHLFVNMVAQRRIRSVFFAGPLLIRVAVRG